jgi:hypothetical protein
VPSPEVVSFTLPWVPPALNRALRSHWAPRRQTLHTATALLLAAGAGGREPERSPVRVTIQMYRRNGMDQDGAAGACKPIFDALVRLGWARDDRPRWMEQDVRPVILDRQGEPRTEIEIVRLEKRERAVPSSEARRNGGGIPT